MNEFTPQIIAQVRNIYELGRNVNLQDDIETDDGNARRVGQYCRENVKYYEMAQQNPTIANVIYRDTFKKCDKEHLLLVKEGKETLSDFSRKTLLTTQNAFNVNELEPVMEAIHSFAEKIRTLYPNTDWIRDFSVVTDRIVLDKVNGKASFWHKLKVGLFMKKNGIKTFFRG